MQRIKTDFFKRILISSNPFNQFNPHSILFFVLSFPGWDNIIYAFFQFKNLNSKIVNQG